MKIIVNYEIKDGNFFVFSVESEKREECHADGAIESDNYEWGIGLIASSVAGLLKKAKPKHEEKIKRQKKSTEGKV